MSDVAFMTIQLHCTLASFIFTKKFEDLNGK